MRIKAGSRLEIADRGNFALVAGDHACEQPDVDLFVGKMHGAVGEQQVCSLGVKGERLAGPFIAVWWRIGKRLPADVLAVSAVDRARAGKLRTVGTRTI